MERPASPTPLLVDRHVQRILRKYPQKDWPAVIKWSFLTGFLTLKAEGIAGRPPGVLKGYVQRLLEGGETFSPPASPKKRSLDGQEEQAKRQSQSHLPVSPNNTSSPVHRESPFAFTPQNLPQTDTDLRRPPNCNNPTSGPPKPHTHCVDLEEERPPPRRKNSKGLPGRRVGASPSNSRSLSRGPRQANVYPPPPTLPGHHGASSRTHTDVVREQQPLHPKQNKLKGRKSPPSHPSARVGGSPSVISSPMLTRVVPRDDLPLRSFQTHTRKQYSFTPVQRREQNGTGHTQNLSPVLKHPTSPNVPPGQSRLTSSHPTDLPSSSPPRYLTSSSLSPLNLRNTRRNPSQQAVVSKGREGSGSHHDLSTPDFNPTSAGVPPNPPHMMMPQDQVVHGTAAETAFSPSSPSPTFSPEGLSSFIRGGEQNNRTGQTGLLPSVEYTPKEFPDMVDKQKKEKDTNSPPPSYGAPPAGLSSHERLKNVAAVPMSIPRRRKSPSPVGRGGSQMKALLCDEWLPNPNSNHATQKPSGSPDPRQQWNSDGGVGGPEVILSSASSPQGRRRTQEEKEYGGRVQSKGRAPQGKAYGYKEVRESRHEDNRQLSASPWNPQTTLSRFAKAHEAMNVSAVDAAAEFLSSPVGNVLPNDREGSRGRGPAAFENKAPLFPKKELKDETLYIGDGKYLWDGGDEEDTNTLSAGIDVAQGADRLLRQNERPLGPRGGTRGPDVKIFLSARQTGRKGVAGMQKADKWSAVARNGRSAGAPRVSCPRH